MNEIKKNTIYLDKYDVEVNEYLTYDQIQQIVNKVIKFDVWAERQSNIDLLLMYHATNLSKEEIIEIGHDDIVQSGLLDTIKNNIKNVNKVYEAIDYTESVARSLSIISKQLPNLFDEVVKKVEKNVNKK